MQVDGFSSVKMFWVALAILEGIRCQSGSPYFTNLARVSFLGDKCSTTNRNTLYQKYGAASGVTYQSFFANNYAIDNALLYRTLLDVTSNGDISAIFASITSDTKGFIFYFVPFLAGLVILLMITPFLLCCMNCPINRCKHPGEQSYTNCQKFWPILTLILLSVLILVTAIIGISSQYTIKNSYQNIQCSATVVIDDVLNGNSSYLQTNGNTFFIGISTLYQDLISLNNKIDAISNSVTPVSSSGQQMPNIRKQLTNGVSLVSQIASGTSNGSLELQYNTPLDASTNLSGVSSFFPSILGNATTNNTLIGNHVNAIITASNTVVSEITAADNLQNMVSDFKANVPAIFTQLQASVKNLQQTSSTINDILTLGYKSKIIQNVEFLYYGLILILTVFLLLGLILTIFCKYFSCRYIIYLSCFFLFILTIVSFAVVILMSFASTIFYSGCLYLEYGLASPNNFVEISNKFSISSTEASKYTNCLSGGSGQFLNEVAGVKATNYMSILTSAMNNITNLNGNALATSIAQSASPLASQVASYAKAATLDINDQTSINILQQLSNPSLNSCSDAGFLNDSWVPSISQTDNAIPCTLKSANQADNSTCINATNFANRQTGCTGCMDTFSLFFNNQTSTDVLSSLSSRYPACSTFNTRLANVWSNFYKKKIDILGPVKARETTARVQVVNATNTLNSSIPLLFSGTISNLYSIAQPQLDTRYGLLGGLNCLTIGEDLQLFQTTTCQNTFSYSFFHRITTGIISFSLLMLLCCITCVRYRYNKQILQFLHSKDHDKNPASPKYMDDPMSDGRLNGVQV